MTYQDIAPARLSTLGPDVRRIDVREPDEYTGPLGHLPDAELVPLGTLEAASADWPRDAPLLLICRSGGRSARAAQALAQRGFQRLYNLAGGMLAVRESPPGSTGG
ncbi:rhodanese-like domain-containing protein [Corallococcus sp. bb12-1]|uniref:rhodanese-like domain-containing protein n=1 Tax=Corallococcus sp. bb12-1 TaxID=2996784 RepID=UPI00226FE81A|nr:rhodanese-like domain-containing protein [Corallococcus sp. bb12-1]MCY1040771.1 rhodanese-like domain-containing protein [Corallococcus sp. bb12-1]